MKIGIIGDIHSNRELLSKAIQAAKDNWAELLLCVGDFSSVYIRAPSEYSLSHAEMLSKYYKDIELTFDQINECGLPWFFVPGNHDLPDYFKQDNNLDRKIVDYKGQTLFGIGGSSGETFGWPYEWDSEEFDSFPRRPIDIIVSHAPPYGHCDLLYKSTYHVGSKRLADYADKTVRANFLVCGHIHEGAGVSQMEYGCLVLNAGAFGQPYPKHQIGVIDTETKETSLIKLA